MIARIMLALISIGVVSHALFLKTAYAAAASFGPGCSMMRSTGEHGSQEREFVYSAEATIGIGYPNQGHAIPFLWPWMSGGLYGYRMDTMNTYIEAGATLFFVSMGGGYTFADERHPHIYIGLTLPLCKLDSYHIAHGSTNFYAAPFARINPENGKTYTIGFMLKAYIAFDPI